MEQETPVSSLGNINLDAKPKKSILKRSEPEVAGGGDGDEGAAGAAQDHVPFSHIIPELSRLEGLGGADRGNSDLQSVSSAASLSPLSSDEQLDGAEPAAAGSPRRGNPGRPAGRGHVLPRRRRSNNRRGRVRGTPRGPPGMAPMEVMSLEPPPPGTASPHHLALEDRSPSPLRLVRYSPSPPRELHVRHSPRRSPGRHSPSRRRSPPRRSPPRRNRPRPPENRVRRSRSRSPRRRSRSPGRYRRGRSPRSGRRRWSRSPSPTPRRRRSRSRSRSPPWGRNLERSILAAMSRGSKGPAPAGYGPPAGIPGYPPMQYAAPHPYNMPQPMPFAGQPRPPMPMQMVPGVNMPFGQPMYPGAPQVAPVYIQPPQQPQPQLQLQSPGAAASAAGGGVSERIDSASVLREVERRRQQKSAAQPARNARQLTDVHEKQRETAAAPPAAAAEEPAPKPPHKLPSEAVVSKELAEIQKKKPWMTQELWNLKLDMNNVKKEHKTHTYFTTMSKQWNKLVVEAKQKKGMADMQDIIKQTLKGDQVSLSAAAVAKMTARLREHVDRRDRMAGELQQLKLQQRKLDTSNIVIKKGLPACNTALTGNLKRQGELVNALDWELSVVEQLKKVLEPSASDQTDGILNGTGEAIVRAAREEVEAGGGATTSKSEVDYLLLGDETLSAVQVYIRELPTRATFGTALAAERIRLVSRPDAALCSVEFRHWVRAAVRQSAAGALVLLASAGCLEAETGSWSAAAAVAPLLPLLRDLRADGLDRVVVVGVPTAEAGAKDRAAQFNRALQDQLETAGPHVPRVTYTPIKGGPQDGFGEQTEGGLTLDLYRTLLMIIRKCEQKPQQAVPGLPLPPGEGPQPLQSVEDAAESLQGLMDGLRGRLAGEEAAGFGAVAALLEKIKTQGTSGAEQLLRHKQEEQELAAEDPGVFFRDPADHICLHCEIIFLNAKNYLEHLKSADHIKRCQTSQNAPEAPWRKDIPAIEKKTKNAESKPIKGLDMFIRVECWYCKVCDMFVGDLRCASSHLKSRRHNAKYDEYLENNPSYHAVVGETRSRLLLQIADREQERTRRRLREEAEKRADKLNERMRRQSEGGSAVQDVTDEPVAGAAGSSAPPVTPPAAGKKAGIKLNLLAAPAQPPEELGQLKRKVQATLAAEQEAKRLKEEAAEEEEEKEVEAEVKTEKTDELVPTVSNQPAAAAAKVKMTLAEKAPQKPAASGAAAKRKVMPIVGKLPKLRQRKPTEVAKTEKPTEPPPAAPLSKSDQAALELANKPEILASIPAPVAPPPAAPRPPAATRPPGVVAVPQTEAISDEEEDEVTPVDMLDLLDIDLPDADDSRADAEELKMLGICDEDVAAQQLPATRPPP